VTLVREHEPLEDPAIGLRRVVVELELVGPTADVAHARDALPLDAGCPITESLGEPVVPDVRRLDDVVVDADDEGNVGCGHGVLSHLDLTPCQIVASGAGGAVG
jgi:hypothetical protein